MKLLSIKILGMFAAVGLLAGLTSGCAWSIGDGKEHTVIQKPTRGQELLDLKRAKDAGAMSEEEYNCKKQEILK